MYSKIQPNRKTSNASLGQESQGSHKRPFRKGFPRRISTRSCQLQMASTTQLRQLAIELDEGEVCFAPGDVISGCVIVAASRLQPTSAGIARQQSVDVEKLMQQQREAELQPERGLEIVELKMKVHGGARVKGRNKGQPGREQSFMEMEAELIGTSEAQKKSDLQERLVPPGGEKIVKFEIRLPQTGLCTSIESKSASILYAVRVALTYKTLTNETRRVNAVRGFTLVECFDVARLPNFYFQPTNHHLNKKFGLFSCTGGQIRLHFSLNRSAFVSGENIVIEGRIENRTDRRVDKVAAVLQQVVVVQGSQKDVNLNLLDVTDIHEDNLALFVDQGTTLKLERNFALPPLPPSTYALDGSEPELVYASYELKQRVQSAVDMSRRYRRTSAQNQSAHGQEQRFLKVLYQLCVRVTTGGVEVMEINVPVCICSLPQRKLLAPDQLSATLSGYQNAFSKAAAEAAATFPRGSGRLFSISMSLDDDGDPMALFMQNRKETVAKLGQPGETYICNKSDLNFTNKYPFFVNLPTSSKQSRKVSILANAIRAESSFICALKEEHERQTGQTEHRQTSMQNGKALGGNSETGMPLNKMDPVRMLPGPNRRQSTLPPVEVLVEHFRRSSVATGGELPRRSGT